MKDEKPQLTFNDVRDLLDKSELADVVLYEISGSRTDEQKEDGGYSLQVLTRVTDTEFEVRIKANVAGSGGEYVADAGAVFTLAGTGKIEEGIAREFAEKVGVMAVYPYVRAAIGQTAASLGLDRPVLPLLRTGAVTLTKDEPPAQENDASDQDAADG